MDASGAVVPGAKVVVAKIVATTVTDQSGSFRLQNVAPGEHLVLVESQGFLLWSRTGVGVEEGKASHIAAELAVAPVKERVISQSELEPKQIELYSKMLRIMKEPGLCEVSVPEEAETYRFIWLRTYDKPMVVRVDMEPNGSARVTVKAADEWSGDEPGKLKTTKTRKLSSQEAEHLRSIVNEADFWRLPSRVNSGIFVLHGASWTLEGTKGGTCHVVDRESPESGPLRSLGLGFLLNIARLKLLYQEVY